MGEDEVHKPVRRAVKQAADQLRPLKDSGLPLVVVLANPRDYRVALDTKEVVHALYGDATIQFPVYLGTGPTPDFRPDDAKFITGRNGQIRNVAQYISAVVLLRHRLNEEDFFAQSEHEFVIDYKERNPGEVEADAIGRSHGPPESAAAQVRPATKD